MTRVLAKAPRDVRERLNTLAALVEAGVPRKHVARILGYAHTQTVTNVAQAIGADSATIHDRDRPKSIAQRLGPRPCKSCLVELPAGHGFPRCVACDRAHHRYGVCACGYAIRMSAPKCKRCGKERPEALRTRGKARQLAFIDAAIADPETPLVEIDARFGYSPGACRLRQKELSALRRKAVQRMVRQAQNEKNRAHMRHVRELVAERKRANAERRAQRRAVS